jgi:hypothetical protein
MIPKSGYRFSEKIMLKQYLQVTTMEPAANLIVCVRYPET